MTLKPAALPHPLQSESYSPPTSPFLAKGILPFAWSTPLPGGFSGVNLCRVPKKRREGGIKTK